MQVIGLGVRLATARSMGGLGSVSGRGPQAGE